MILSYNQQGVLSPTRPPHGELSPRVFIHSISCTVGCSISHQTTSWRVISTCFHPFYLICSWVLYRPPDHLMESYLPAFPSILSHMQQGALSPTRPPHGDLSQRFSIHSISCTAGCSISHQNTSLRGYPLTGSGSDLF